MWFGAQLAWRLAGGAVPLLTALRLVFLGDPSPLVLASLCAPFCILLALRVARIADGSPTLPWGRGDGVGSFDAFLPSVLLG
jgi:hypothetical protein